MEKIAEDGVDVSGGEWQRIAMARLYYQNAELKILDEPTASLTPQEIEGLMEIISNLTADGKSVILITHKLKGDYRILR